MIRFFQEHLPTGTGIGYQISSYFMMRSLAKVRGFEWVIKSKEFKPFRHTFNSSITINEEYENFDYYEADEFEGLPKISESISDDMTLFGYSTPVNWYINHEIFESVKSEISLKENIKLKCQEFRNKFDSEVIALHVRIGEFIDISNGKFVCGSDYYLQALREMPDNLPILVFTNDRESAIRIIEELSEHIDRSRFTLITDIYNNNEIVDDLIGQRLDQLVDFDGVCKYDYRVALTKMALENLNIKFGLDMNPGIQASDDYIFTYQELIDEMSEIVRNLDKRYQNKIKEEAYNHSYDFTLMLMCDYIVISNSTFGLWATLLGNYKKVVYPMYWMQDVDNYDGIPTLLPDMGDYDQTLDKGGWIVARLNCVGKKNPDARKLKIIGFDDDF